MHVRDEMLVLFEDFLRQLEEAELSVGLHGKPSISEYFTRLQHAIRVVGIFTHSVTYVVLCFQPRVDLIDAQQFVHDVLFLLGAFDALFESLVDVRIYLPKQLL